MIEKVLEHYGADLHRVSEHGWRSIKCPFHDDRTASGRVSIDKDAFACLACGVKGSAITLIMNREGLGYDDARRFASEVLGESVGHLPRATSDKPRVRSKWRDRLFA